MPKMWQIVLIDIIWWKIGACTLIYIRLTNLGHNEKLFGEPMH